MYKILFTKQAKKDLEKLKRNNLSERAKDIIDILKVNPYQNSPPYEKLVGNLYGYYSRRINIQHRVVYSIIEDSKEIIILRMWTHYE